MIQYVNIGGQPNDGSGDLLRTAFAKINESILHLSELADASIVDIKNMISSPNDLAHIFIGNSDITTLFSPISHDHNSVYSLLGHHHNSAYASLGHNHNGVYSLLGHDHGGLYSLDTHIHDERYSLLVHAHPEYEGGGTVDTNGWFELMNPGLPNEYLRVKKPLSGDYDIQAFGFSGMLPSPLIDNLPIASATVFGVIKVGANLTITNGVLSADAVGGGGSVNISGVPVANQLAVWHTADTIKGLPGITFDGTTLFVQGNVVAQGEISAFQGTAPGSWWDSMPVATDTTLGGIMYNASQFEVVLGSFQIKAGVLVPASHQHSWADITSGKPTTISGYGITDAFNGAFSSLTGKPTTKAGYGITNVPDISGTPLVDQVAIWTDADTQKGSPNMKFDGTTLSIVGNIIATGEISAFQGTAPGNWWDSMPWATSTTLGGIKYDPAIFERNVGDQLTIKPGVVSGASHDHNTLYFLKAETTSAISVAIANLVASSPATLDTLNELATALGNDPNFATTVSTSIGLKAPINNPTFTGTVSGITKTMVGLGNVDNTSDANKPVSSAQQTALNLKATIGVNPAISRLAIWSNGTTIKGDTNLTYDGSYLNVTGEIRATADVVAYASGAPSGSFWDTMPAATTTTLGGIIVGPNFSILGGVLSIAGGVAFNLSANYSPTGLWNFTQIPEVGGIDVSLVNHNHTFAALISKPTTLSGYGITDAMSTSHVANAITGTNISNWNTAFGWNNHASAGYAQANQTMYLGTTAVAINRGSGALTLAGVSVDYAYGSSRVASVDSDRTLATYIPTYEGGQHVRFFFANASAVGTGGSYAGVMHFAPYTGTSVSTGDASYQMAFGSTAVNGGGVPSLRIRKGIDSTWNAWYDIHTESSHPDSGYVHIAGTETITGAKRFATDISIGSNGTYTLIKTPVAGAAIQFGANSGTWDRNLHLGFVDGLGAFNANLSIIHATGNVGIGTTSPQTTLHVHNTASNSTVLILSDGSGYVADNGPTLLFRHGVAVEDLASIRGGFEASDNDNFGNLVFGTRTSNALGIQEKMRISSSGRIFIGIASSTRDFILSKSVAGDVVSEFANTNTAGTTARNILLCNTDASGSALGLYSYGTANTGSLFGEPMTKGSALIFGGNNSKAIIGVSNAAIPLMFATNGDVRMTLATSGNLTVTGDVIAYG